MDFNFGAASGIIVAPSGQSRLFVSDSFIANNGNGILIRPSGSGIVNATVKQVHLETNLLGLGIDSTAGNGAVNLSLVDSVAAGNGAGSTGVATLTNGAKGRGQCHDQPDEPLGESRGPAVQRDREARSGSAIP